MDISIIILSYNVRDLLQECLGSLTKNGSGQNRDDRRQDVQREIIVVENASSDGSAQMVEQEFPQVKVIRAHQNLGFAAGNNLGVKHAQGEYLFFLNSDTKLVDLASLLQAVRFFEQNPDIGILSFQLLNPNGSLQRSGRSLPTFWRELCYYSGLWGLSPGFFTNLFDFRKHQDFSKIAEVEDGGGAAIMIRRALFEQLGGWDERFFMYYEDADLSRRVWQAGYKVVYFPGMQVLHHQGQSEKVSPGAQKYLWESLPKYAEKWWPKWQVVLLKMLLRLRKKL